MANKSNKGISINKLALGDYQANCYVVSCPDTGEAVIIDAPGTAEQILSSVQGLKVSCMVLTHTHPDHTEALAELRRLLCVPLALHGAESARIEPPAERVLHDGEILRLGSHEIKVIHTPGHTPGGICLLHGKHLFSGDTLFPGGPGKTASPKDFSLVVDSITRKLFRLPDDTLVHPGHGPDTVLGKEKKEFAAFSSRPHPTDLCGDVVWLSS
ncbi:MAG TPA: MBL fold metallo-hydrolase [Dehalococcoidia bacterium]|nr:MBL fold metallo-hydrolase [Dehalococcoidia bacterium]